MGGVGVSLVRGAKGIMGKVVEGKVIGYDDHMEFV